jgi:nitroreductase
MTAQDELAVLGDLVRRNRSCRRYRPGTGLCREDLLALVDLARGTASGSNCQPLRYFLVWDRAACGRVFPHTKWAGRLGGWRPAETEQPAAYVLLLAAPNGGPTIQADAGIAMQTMLLGATARGWSGCMLGAIDRPAIRAALGLPEGLDLLYVVALGVKAETWCLEEARNGEITYYRDSASVHHVPKRPLAEVVLN